MFDSRGEQKYNLDAIEQLLRGHLLNLQAVDMQIAQVRYLNLSENVLEKFVKWRGCTTCASTASNWNVDVK